MPRKDMTGIKFGRLTVIEDAGKEPQGQMKWLCKCDCGNYSIVTGRNLRRNHTTSCGCYMLERITKHGHNRPNQRTPEYTTWHSMMQRCCNKKSQAYKTYGAKGIKVCKRWKDFKNFYADMGDRPSQQHSLDRWPNKKGDYKPSNCRWATPLEQVLNRSVTKYIEYDGQKLIAKEWAKIIGISETGIRSRLQRGWPIDKVLSSKNFNTKKR